MQDHRERHKQLHQALDELAADWAAHQPLGKLFSNSTIMELMRWSHEQTREPDEELPHITFTLPNYCYSCGAYLMGGATQHKPDCEIQRLIDSAMPPTEAETKEGEE